MILARPKPPAILTGPHPPRCPMSLCELIDDGHAKLCPSCDALWLDDEHEGQWLEPDRAACGSVCRPYELAAEGDPLRGAGISVTPLTWRCGLARGHDERHRTLRLPGLEWDAFHAHTHMPGVPPLDTTTGQPCHCDVPAHL